MAANAFDTEITETAEALTGPWRQPRQMLHAQVYDAHASIHDDATAQKLGFKGGTIEGPTHFSQFAPLGARLWGQAWFESGCLSAHYRNACFEGEDKAGAMVATMLLNMATLKDSYAPYEEEHRRLYGDAGR